MFDIQLEIIALFVSIIAIIISILSLYFSQFKGPDINIYFSDKPKLQHFPIKKYTISYDYYRPLLQFKEKSGKTITLIHSKNKKDIEQINKKINSIFINQGSSSGSIFDFDIKPYIPLFLKFSRKSKYLTVNPFGKFFLFSSDFQNEKKPIIIDAKSSYPFIIDFNVKNIDLTKPDKLLFDYLKYEGAQCLISYNITEGRKIKHKKLILNIKIRLDTNY